jgi:hypothetical protein
MQDHSSRNTKKLCVRLNGISKVFLLIYSPLKTVLSWSIPRDTRLSSILNPKVSPGSERRKRKEKQPSSQ